MSWAGGAVVYVCVTREFGRWKVNSLAVEKGESSSGNSGLALPLDPEFMQTIRLLGRRPTLQTITESVIKKYGTHVLLSATLGGTVENAGRNSDRSNGMLFSTSGANFTVCCLETKKHEIIFLDQCFWIMNLSGLVHRTFKTELRERWYISIKMQNMTVSVSSLSTTGDVCSCKIPKHHRVKLHCSCRLWANYTTIHMVIWKTAVGDRNPRLSWLCLVGLVFASKNKQ